MTSSTTEIDVFLERPLQDRLEWSQTRQARKAQWRVLLAALLLGDFLLVGAAFRLAYWLRFETGLPIFRLNVVPSFPFYIQLAMALIPVQIAIFAMLGLYHRENLLGGAGEYALVFRGTTVGLLLLVVAGFLEPALVFARGWLLLAWLLSFILVAAGRFVLRRMVYFLRRRGYFLSPAVIVGANEEGRLLASQLLRWSTSGLHVLGFVDDGLPVGASVMPGLVNLGRIEDLDTIIETCEVEEAILATSAHSRKEMLMLFRRYGVAEGLNLRLSSGLFEIITTGLNVKEFAYVPLVGVNKVRLTGTDLLLKRTLDIAVALPALILISPLLLLLAILVKVDSRGPAFHRRRVMGVKGRQFDAFKLRTMYVNGNSILDTRPELKEELAHNHKLKDDPRITRVGRFMRKYSLDELPQLINVLLGQMSLVGPRMISPQEMVRYDRWALNLLTVRPGITGLWQVSGRSDLTYEDRVRLDMHYIRNWTIWLDLQLLFQTIPVVFNAHGAY